MRSFDEIHAIAAARKGGAEALERMLPQPVAVEALRATTDDRWLSTMARCLFQAGFNWQVIEARWPGFEAAFGGFDPARVAMYHDAEMDRLLADSRIVRNGAKLAAVTANAGFLRAIAQEHGSMGAFVAGWPVSDHAGLLRLLSQRGARLGGVTGQRVLREMGRDGYLLSADVSARLVAEGVVAKPPSSQRDMAAVQAAFNAWGAQSGRSLAQISRVLAFSIG
ncbi:DNA-3-methyladenine glycosylase I [Oceanicella sp. SM1341]|uniref:DNA-3-methyladenine glycosylase I n=1 Tax=Oceanicella sp. SM1341 TaxID=1548889 RepID=UPI000E4858A3|nr:DNA-3-methyladenine glycosylase I [Oceanicella sp. SM1341]